MVYPCLLAFLSRCRTFCGGYSLCIGQFLRSLYTTKPEDAADAIKKIDKSDLLLYLMTGLAMLFWNKRSGKPE